MNVDFALVLVILLFLSGGIWALDSLFFKPKRPREFLEDSSSETDISGDHRELQSKEPKVVEYARSFFPVILIVIVLRSFLVEPFRIPSGSMMPTLQNGDFILVNKFTYGLRLPVMNSKFIELSSPQRGDVIVFRYPRDPSIDYIKRVIGLPGDRIIYKNKVLTVNGQKITQTPLGRYVGTGAARSMNGADHRREDLGIVMHDILVRPGHHSPNREYIVPEGQYFVMGDNRDNSNDSRFWGTVPEENLVGRAFMIWMNWDSGNGSITWSRIGQEIE